MSCARRTTIHLTGRAFRAHNARMKVVTVNTTLPVLVHGLLSAMAKRAGGSEALNSAIGSLVKNEAERLSPGFWDQALAAAEHASGDGQDARAISEQIQRAFLVKLATRAT